MHLDYSSERHFEAVETAVNFGPCASFLEHPVAEEHYSPANRGRELDLGRELKGPEVAAAFGDRRSRSGSDKLGRDFRRFLHCPGSSSCRSVLISGASPFRSIWHGHRG